jgi:hypothetical protein
MSEMTDHDAPAETGEQRCPACGALRPPAVAWCTQCYARFDTPDASGSGSGRGAGADGTPGTEAVPAAPELGPAHPVRDDARPAADPAEVEARAQELLARLSAEGGGGGRVRSLSGRVQGRGPKIGLVVVGTLVLTGLLFGAMAVLGALL